MNEAQSEKQNIYRMEETVQNLSEALGYFLKITDGWTQRIKKAKIIMVDEPYNGRVYTLSLEKNALNFKQNGEVKEVYFQISEYYSTTQGDNFHCDMTGSMDADTSNLINITQVRRLERKSDTWGKTELSKVSFLDKPIITPEESSYVKKYR